MKELHHINLENMKFNHKTESPEELLVKFQNLALKVYLTPVDIPVAPVDGDVQMTRTDSIVKHEKIKTDGIFHK